MSLGGMENCFVFGAQNRVGKCYGKNKATAKAMDFALPIDNENIVPSTVPFRSTSAERPLEDDSFRPGFSPTNASKKRNQPNGDDIKISRTRHTLKTASMKTVNQTKQLQETLNKGHAEDLDVLITQIKEFHEGSAHTLNLSAAPPSTWSALQKNRFQDWILKLGFSKIDNSRAFVYSNEVDTLVKAMHSIERPVHSIERPTHFASISVPRMEAPKPRSMSTADTTSVPDPGWQTRNRSQSTSQLHNKNNFGTGPNQAIIDEARSPPHGVVRPGSALTIDTNFNFHKPRFDCPSTQSHDSDGSSPYPSSTPRIDSQSDSRPASRCRQSPVSEIMINTFDKISLLATSNTPSNNQRRGTKPMFGQGLAKIESVDSDGSEGKDYAQEAPAQEHGFSDSTGAFRSLRPEHESSFSSLPSAGEGAQKNKELAAVLSFGELTEQNMAHLKSRDLDRVQSPESDVSTVLDESFNSSDDPHMPETRKNSMISSAELAALSQQLHCGERTPPPASPPTLPAESAVDAMDCSSSGPPCHVAFSAVDPMHMTTPAFDRISHQPNPAESHGDGMRALFAKSSSRIRRREGIPPDPSLASRAANMESSGGGKLGRKFPTHPPASSTAVQHVVEVAPIASNSNMFTPQTKPCGDFTWMQSLCAEPQVLERLRQWMVESWEMPSCAETTSALPDSPHVTRLSRAVTLPNRLSSGSDRNSCDLFTLKSRAHERESIGSCFDEAHTSRFLCLSEPSPVKSMHDHIPDGHDLQRPSGLALPCLPALQQPSARSQLGGSDMECVTRASCEEFFSKLSSGRSMTHGGLSITRSATTSFLPNPGLMESIPSSPRSNRKARQERQRKALQQRKSIAANKGKTYGKGGRERRQSMAFVSRHDGHGVSALDDSSLLDSGDIHDPQLLSCNYTPEMFRKHAVIVGATNTHDFDNLSPVVHASLHSSEQRVCDIRETADNQLHVCVSFDGHTQWVDLTSQWRYLFASPCGILVTSGAPTWTEMVVFYYLPKHPADWRSHRAPRKLAPPDDSAFMNTSSSHQINLYYDITSRSNDSSTFPSSSLHAFHTDRRDGAMDVMLCSTFEEEEEEASERSSNREESACGMVERFHGFGMEPRALLSPAAASVQSLLTAPTAAGRRVFHNGALLSVLLEFLPSRVLSSSLLYVSKQWTLTGIRVLSNRLHSRIWAPRSPRNTDWTVYKNFLSDHPVGNFVASGACKDVFCVRKKGGESLTAVSVMDLNDLRERDMKDCVVQELDVSMVCSALSGLRICPNTIRIFKTFRTCYEEHKGCWKNDLAHNLVLQAYREQLTDRAARTPGLSLHSLFAQEGTTVHDSPCIKLSRPPSSQLKNSFQLIQMEYCPAGDMESFLARFPMIQDDLPIIRSYMFQMCYALYSVRECFSMRHYDIKLLNFFLTSPDSLSSQNSEHIPISKVEIGFGPQLYSLPITGSESCGREASIVKLADFGTSLLGTSLLGQPITLNQFTTIENAAPEMFLLGSSARQSLALDTFPLGLCFLHLLSSPAPYEELLHSVRCPLFLYEQLLKVYHVDSTSDPYFIIREVVSSLCEDSFVEKATVQQVYQRACKNMDSCPYTVVMDTIYRYLVLMSSHLTLGLIENDIYRDNPVYRAIAHSLGLGSNSEPNQPLQRAKRTATVRSAGQMEVSSREYCMKAFSNDAQRWSLATGIDPIMIIMRRRLKDLGAERLLESMLHFNPSSRCSMLEALQHDVFKALQSPGPVHAQDSSTVQFLHYYRSSQHHAHDLPHL